MGFVTHLVIQAVFCAQVCAKSKQFLGEIYPQTVINDTTLIHNTVETGSILRCFGHCGSDAKCNYISFDEETTKCSLIESGPLSDLPNSKIESAPHNRSSTGRMVPYTIIPRDCENIDTTNVSRHLIQPLGFPKPTLVICDQGWTVVQKRFNGSVDFDRTWEDYKHGFGNLGGEFWLGNEIIHKLTKGGDYKMAIDMGLWNGLKTTAAYPEFQLLSESENYTLESLNFLGARTTIPFTTNDADNDGLVGENCAVRNKGAWWYEQCASTNPNALYPVDGTTCDNPYDVGNKEYCMKLTVVMMMQSSVIKVRKVS